MYHVNIKTVDSNAAIDAQTGARSTSSTMVEKIHIFDANVQKQLLLEYKQNSKIKTQE